MTALFNEAHNMQTKPSFKIAALGCLVFSALLVSSQGFAQGATNFTPEWVQRSNDIAYKVLESQAGVRSRVFRSERR